MYEHDLQSGWHPSLRHPHNAQETHLFAILWPYHPVSNLRRAAYMKSALHGPIEGDRRHTRPYGRVAYAPPG